MNHQPYEDWIFEEELTSDQHTQLKNHLAVCEDCRRLNEAMRGISYVLENSTELNPPVGFSQRWEKFAEERREQEGNMAAWVVLGALIVIASAILYVNFGSLWMSSINPLQLLVSNLVSVVSTITGLAKSIEAARSVLQVIPGNLVVLTTVVGGTLAFFWVTVWLAALKRVSSIQRRVE